jgi:hypothetical protein
MNALPAIDAIRRSVGFDDQPIPMTSGAPKLVGILQVGLWNLRRGGPSKNRSGSFRARLPNLRDPLSDYAVDECKGHVEEHDDDYVGR